MKKRYIALIVCTVLLTVIIAGGFLLFRNGNAFHEGHALISKNGDFIFVDDRGSPIVMGDADERKFSDITDGDRVLMLYGVVLESYPGQSSAYLCIKLSDGTPDDVNEDTVEQLKELGWL